GLGNGWGFKKQIVPSDTGVSISFALVPNAEAEAFELVEGVVRDFNANSVADSETRYSFKVRQTIFVVLPIQEPPGAHPYARRENAAGQPHVIIEFQDEFGCIYGRPEDMLHDAEGELVIDWQKPLCKADR